MRPGCQYVLHSTSQLYPHKRKHEKRDLDAPIVLHTPNTNPASQPPIQLASGTIVYPVKGVYNGAKQEEMEAGEVSSKASQDKHETSDSAAVMPNATAGKFYNQTPCYMDLHEPKCRWSSTKCADRPRMS